MTEQKVGRREFLRLSTVTAFGTVLAACAAPSVTPQPATPQPATPQPVEGGIATPVPTPGVTQGPAVGAEPPLLAERVAAATLPPLVERLPLAPFLVGNREAIGQYGGEIRMIHHDPIWISNAYEFFCDQVLKFSDADLTTLVAHAVESWETSEDGQSHTIHMRKGMKWSDGEPLTTEDVDFWWNDYANVEDLGWIGAAFGGVRGQQAQVEIIDDYTFRVTFEYPFGIFPLVLARHTAGMPDGPFMPKHYLQQFHAKYADEAFLQAKVTELGVEMWQQVFNHYADWGMNIWQFPADGQPHPTLAAWIPVQYPSEGLIILERNPYYWKVDEAGNQLPYIDNIRFDYVSSVEVMDMKIIQGELDFVGEHDVTIASYPLYKENESKANYTVGDYVSCMADRFVLFPRHTLPDDPVLEEIVNHPNWVKALSVAIDREEINQSVFYGMARMGQLAPLPTSSYYKEEYGTAWAEYDPDLANQLLDEMGLEERDSESFRLRPDGQRLSYNIEHCGIRIGAAAPAFVEMITTYWRNIGIEATNKEILESLYQERMRNDQIHCGVWHADRCTDLLLPVDMCWFIPVGAEQQGGASAAWVRWYDADEEARKEQGLKDPPDYIRELYDWHDKVKEVVNLEERIAWVQKILDALAERPLEIGTVLECPMPMLSNKNMRNLPPAKAPIGWDTYGVATYHPEAFFYEGGQRA